jgi:hypothetical protein
MHAFGHFGLCPLDLGFEPVAYLKLVFDEIVEPISNGPQILGRQSRQGRFDLFDRTHILKIRRFFAPVQAEKMANNCRMVTF